MIQENKKLLFKKENKELLLKDLCCRLPYHVKMENKLGSNYGLVLGNADLTRLYYNDFGIYSEINLSLPYLFPMSSMTEEQLFEVQEILGKNEIKIDDGFLRIVDSDRNVITYLEILAVLEWFYKNHFDINNLIPKGLAIDATGLNIY